LLFPFKVLTATPAVKAFPAAPIPVSLLAPPLFGTEGAVWLLAVFAGFAAFAAFATAALAPFPLISDTRNDIMAISVTLTLKNRLTVCSLFNHFSDYTMTAMKDD
jgi:hypothetical protein